MFPKISFSEIYKKNYSFERKKKDTLERNFNIIFDR